MVKVTERLVADIEEARRNEAEGAAQGQSAACAASAVDEGGAEVRAAPAEEAVVGCETRFTTKAEKLSIFSTGGSDEP